MNPNLNRLHPYPFAKLAELLQGVTPPAAMSPITLAIGEPQHPAPEFVSQALGGELEGLSRYPTIQGHSQLRSAIAAWLRRRFHLPRGTLTPEQHVLPVNGTREALFAFAQCVVDCHKKPLVMMPNPFYQIYEGAALLAGGEPYYLNTFEENDFLPAYEAVPESVWRRCSLLYLCSPGNPSGRVTPLEVLQNLIDIADHYDIILAADECYADIYCDETNPPVGLLQACAQRGRYDYRRCVVFHSLSKRSNVPGLRSGFVAGDREILASFRHYRTYHGCSMPVFVQNASATAWSDTAHAQVNRAAYRRKFAAVLDILAPPLVDVTAPEASFYLWPHLPVDDLEFARGLFAQYNVKVLPGSFLARTVDGVNPGRNRARLALVAPVAECIEAAQRIRKFILSL